MNKDELLALREQLLADITPLVIENSGDGIDRFGLLLRVIQTGKAPQDVYTRAYESAKVIQEGPEKLNALLALLDEVEVDLSTDETREAVPVVDTPKSNESSESPQFEQHDQSGQYSQNNNDDHNQGS